MATLIQIDGRDPVTGTAVSVNLASHSDDRICHLDGKTWWPVIAQLPRLAYDLFDGRFEGRIGTPASSVGIGVEPWPDFARWMLHDGRVCVWTGTPGDPWGAWTLRFDGRVTAQPRIANGRATVAFAVDDRWLDAPLLTTYAGTGGAEGGPELKGQAKPLSLGAPRFVGGRVVDAANSVVQLSSAGPIEVVEAAFERLARFGPSIGDYASHAALVAAAIPAGAWATALSVGMVRHGAPPQGRLSYHVRGDKVSGWVRLPGAIINRIASLSGGAGRIDATSLADLDAARPWPLSIYAGEQTTARELIQRIAASVNAVAGVDWLGKLFVAPVGIGVPALTLDTTGAALPIASPAEQLEIDAPYWRLAIEAAKTWEVHAFSEVAFTAPLLDRGRYSAPETYREGHIVDLANGSRWLYHATAPSSGNAPPTGVTGNVWWDQLSPATTFGDIDAAAAAKLSLVADGATKNRSFRQVTDPAGNPANAIVNGDEWVELVTPMVTWKRIGGTWQTGANYVTEGSQIGVENGATVGATIPASGSSNIKKPGGGFYTKEELDTSLGTAADTAKVAGVASAILVANANAAKGTAETAATDATAAMVQIEATATDNTLSKQEKLQQAIPNKEAIDASYATHNASAANYGISTTPHVAAYAALTDHLLSVNYTNHLVNTTINRTTYKPKWTTYYAARDAMLKAVADETGKRAEYAKVAGTPTTLGAVNAAEGSKLGGVANGATADMTLTPYGTASVAGNVVTSNSDGDNADGATTAERYLGAVSLGCTVKSVGTYLGIVGTAGQTFNANVGNDGYLRAFYNGELIGVVALVAVGDSVALISDEVAVEIWKNGALTHRFVQAPTRAQTWYARIGCGPRKTVAGVSWRAGSNNNWNGFGGVGLPTPFADVTAAQPIVAKLNPFTGKPKSSLFFHTSAAVGIKKTTTAGPTATLAADGSATITVPAFTMGIPGETGQEVRNYAGATIAGKSPGTGYTLYTIDPNFEGGARTILATTNPDDLTQAGAALVGSVTTPTASGTTTTGGTAPTSGGGSTGGGKYAIP